MAHNINTYIGRESAWHILGTVTGKYSTWAEILHHGGLDFEVIKDYLFNEKGERVSAYGIFRTDNNAFLGVVGDGYNPIDHKQGFEMVDALMGTSDGAHYETAGVLGRGETVWGLADLGLVARVGDDEQKGYLLFATSHNGTMAYQFRLCMERVVCQNTLNVALGEKSKGIFRVKHTRNAQTKIDDAHRALEVLTDDVKTMEAKLNFLATRKVSRESFITIMDRLYPKKKDEKGEAVWTTRRLNILTSILRIYESNDDNAFPEQRGTAYNLLNAVTNFTDHERVSRGDNRAESALFGSGDKLKGLAFETIMGEAGGMPTVKRKEGIQVDWAEMGIKVPELVKVGK